MPRERAQRVSHATGALRRSGARASVSGSPRGEAPRIRLEPEAERDTERAAAALALEWRRIRGGRRRLTERRSLEIAGRQAHRIQRAVGIGIDGRVVADDRQVVEQVVDVEL